MMGKKRKAAEGTRRDMGPEGGRQVQQSHPELVGMLRAAVPGEASELNGGEGRQPSAEPGSFPLTPTIQSATLGLRLAHEEVEG